MKQFINKTFSLVIKPFYWVGLWFWGGAVRVCVFQLGEYKKFSVLRKLIQRYEKKPVMTGREIEMLLAMLKEIGGEKNRKRTDDGLAIIEYMLLRSDDMKKKIEAEGGIWKSVFVDQIDKDTYQIANDKKREIQVIYLADENSEKWKVFFNQVLSEFGWKKISLIDEKMRKKEAYLTCDGPISMKKRKFCFLRCHSPGRSYPMEIKYVGIHLGAGYDVCLFDYRGTNYSVGFPSEGGYYLDVEAIYEELINTYNYQTQDIWVTGFSLGGPVAAYLKMKYHDKGINFVGENTFSSLIDLIRWQCWLVSFLGNMGLPAIETKNEKITKRVDQDYFSILEKFNKIKNKNSSTVIIVSTDKDLIVPKSSSLALYNEAKRFGKSHHFVHKKGEDATVEGHMERPLEDDAVKKIYIDTLLELENENYL